MLIDKEKLKDIIPAIAAEHRFRQAIVEKDYYHRLSEDLDFSYCGEMDLTARSNRSAAIAPIKEKMPGFLTSLGLRSDKPKGEGFNSSRQYVFNVLYPSVITGKEGNIKIEVSLRQKPYDQPVMNLIHHFYKDPFTGQKMIPEHKILSLSLDEAVAEKLKAAITRKDPAIRDYYDLWHIAEAKFDFRSEHFRKILKKKLADEDYQGDFRDKFGLSADKIDLITRQIKTDLIPVIRIDEAFDLDKVFDRFNVILGGFIL